VVSRIAPPAGCVYSGTKAAVDIMTRVLAKELGPRQIRVNAINPGLIETEGTRSTGMLGTDFERMVIARTPLGRIGQPDDISGVAVFLASDAAKYVTGECLFAAGGT
jgi:3-oxoacyl-[acyl-carrier protein] reductase